MAWLHPDSTFHFIFAHLHLGELAILQASSLSRLTTDRHHIIPSDLGDRIGQFLAPAVVSVTAVAHAVIQREHRLQTFSLRRQHGDVRIGNGELGGLFIAGVLKETVVEITLPAVARKCGLHHLMAGARGSAFASGKHREHLQLGHRSEERRNQRLNRHDGAIVGAGIAPAFQVVRARRVHSLDAVRFILGVIGQAEGRLLNNRLAGHGHVRAAIVNRVAPQINDAIKLSEIRSEIGQRTKFIGGRLMELHGLAVVPERVINNVRELMHRLRLTIAGNHQALAGVRLQIFRGTGQPFFLRLTEGVGRNGYGFTKFLGDKRRRRRDGCGTRAQTVVGIGAGLR